MEKGKALRIYVCQNQTYFFAQRRNVEPSENLTHQHEILLVLQVLWPEYQCGFSASHSPHIMSQRPIISLAIISPPVSFLIFHQLQIVAYFLGLLLFLLFHSIPLIQFIEIFF